MDTKNPHYREPLSFRLRLWWSNSRFNLGYRIGGFTSAKRTTLDQNEGR